ncbi:MAG: UDP-N-acetylmuramate dehydrogenase [Sulfurovaceae bacterium]
MFLKNIDLSKHTNIRIGPKIDITIIEKDDIIPKEKYLIGGGANILVSNNPPPLMMLGKDFDYIKMEENSIIIGAATPTGKVLSFAKLPGTLGGMLAMNAGVKAYEIFNILKAISIEGEWTNKTDIEHGYRYAKLGGIALEATFEKEEGFDAKLLDELISLRKNQPKEPSAGSFFKNPKDDYAARLIEACGLKGKQIGGMAWSAIHANFLVNLGEGTFEDALKLINLAKEEVQKKFNINLEEEVKIL